MTHISAHVTQLPCFSPYVLEYEFQVQLDMDTLISWQHVFEWVIEPHGANSYVD